MTNVSRREELVREFYEGKAVFMTGAAGYVGVVLLETLLRCCPGITKIYILLRPKKGVQPEDRKDEVLKRKLFCGLREDQPEVLRKVVVVCGDVSQPQLGMSADDYSAVCEECSVVFHVAAVISFFKSLRFTLMNNVIAANSVIELSRKLKKLDVLVFTSTVFANSNRHCKIREDVYGLPFKPQVFLDALKIEDSDDPLMALYDECLPPWPNYYTFSKCLSENLIAERASDLPVAIVRPSVVISSWKGGMPGYLEEGSGHVTVIIGVGKGFIKVLSAYPDSKMDMIPVDIVANAHVLAGFAVATGRLNQRPLVVNCTTVGQFLCTLEQFCAVLMRLVERHPLPKSYQRVSGVRLEGSPFRYRLATLFEHYLPGTFIDLMLRAMGKKPRIVRMYRFLDSVMATIKFFLLKSWSYDIDNFKGLDDCITEEDKKDLSVNLAELRVEDYFKYLPTGAPFYELDSNTPCQERLLKQRYLLANVLKTVALVLLAILFYIVLSCGHSALT